MWVTCCILVLWLWAEGGQILHDTTPQKINSYHHGNLRCYNTESALTVRVCVQISCTVFTALWRCLLKPNSEENECHDYQGRQIGSEDSFFTATSASFRSPPPQSALMFAVGVVEFLAQPVDDVEDAGVSGMT